MGLATGGGAGLLKKQTRPFHLAGEVVERVAGIEPA